jgi:hypothetical protein
MRALVKTSAGTYGEGGTKKSAALTAEPAGVITEIRPEPAFAGRDVVSDVEVPAVGHPRVRFRASRL